ncbi:hypothetical protein ACHAWF_003765 [Thalassiosira exigua]
MAPLTTTRTLFELRAGSIHTIEVLLQIRLSDISWWNSDLSSHERELYRLIGRRILPVECRAVIEADRAKVRDAAKLKTTEKKKGEIVIGEANLKKLGKEKGTGGRKRGAGKKAKKGVKTSKKQKTSDKNAANGVGDNVASESKEKKLKLLREPGKWIMGKSIQLCYMVEEIENFSSTTLIFRPREDATESDKTAVSDSPGGGEKGGDEVPLATFRQWKKLPKRLNLWVFKFDPDNDPSDLSLSEGGGFPRPELLPMSDIFRPIGGEE